MQVRLITGRASSTMQAPTQWTRLGWQGICLDVPADWSPGRVEGDYATGYLRVEDERIVRLEVRWETPGRRLPEASQLVDNYLKQTRKKLRRKAADHKIVRSRCVPQLGGIDHEVFTWQGGFNAHSLLVVCPQTRRVVHLRVLFEDGKDLKGLARRIFASVATAPKDGLEEWSVFDLRFQVASSWRLEESSLRTGCVRLVFHDGRDVLEVARVSLAEMALRKSSFEKWFEGFFAKALRRCRYEIRPDERRGHPAVRCQGALRARARPFGLLRPRRYLTALAWHCKGIDKIFAVRTVTRTQGDPQVEACAASIPCE